MKKFRMVVLSFVAFLLCTPFVYAECDATESNKLSSLANNVRTSQEVVQKEIDAGEDFNPPDGLTEEEDANYVAKRNYFRIYISNITEELYVTVTNNNTKETKTYTYADAVNGTISFDEKVFIEIVNYTITIHASDKTNCASRRLRTIYITTPMYNGFSESALCDGIEEFYLCHEYLSVKTSFENFESLVNQYRDGKLKADGSNKDKENNEKGFLGFIKEHKGAVILTSVAIIAIGGLVTVIIVKKQRSRIV